MRNTEHAYTSAGYTYERARTPGQLRDYNRQQQQPPKDAPPAPW